MKDYLTTKSEKTIAEKNMQYYKLLFLCSYTLYRNDAYMAQRQQYKDYCIEVGEKGNLFATQWHEITEKERKEWDS